MIVATVQQDEQLIERFLVGAPREADSAFEALVKRHRPTVMSVCLRVLAKHEDAEDAAQATFVALVRNAARIRDRRRVSSWIYSVAYRISLQMRARSARRLAIYNRAVREGLSASTDDTVAIREFLQIVREAVNCLPEAYRTLVVQTYLEGKTCEEVARLLGCPVGTVKGRLWRARGMLRERLLQRVGRADELFA